VQSLHERADDVLEYFPETHVLHAPPPLEEYLPAEQGRSTHKQKAVFEQETSLHMPEIPMDAEFDNTTQSSSKTLSGCPVIQLVYRFCGKIVESAGVELLHAKVASLIAESDQKNVPSVAISFRPSQQLRDSPHALVATAFSVLLYIVATFLSLAVHVDWHAGQVILLADLVYCAAMQDAWPAIA